MQIVSRTTDTRDEILEACDRLMERYGFRKMTMDDLAKEAGVSKRTIYMYFSSKTEVGLSSIGRVVENTHGAIREVAKSDLDSTAKLTEILRRRIMARVNSVQSYRHSLDELFEVVRTAYMGRRVLYFQIERSILQEVLLSGKSLGEFTFEDAEATAQSLLLATNAFIPYSLSVSELGNPDLIQTRLDHMIHILVRGLQTQKS